MTPLSDWSDEINLTLMGRDKIYEAHEWDGLRSMRLAHKTRYKKNVRKSFVRYMKTTYSSEVFKDDYRNDDYSYKRDRMEGKQAVGKAADSSFWEWDKGSFPFFWRSQPEIKNDLRDGTSLWCYVDKLPQNTNKPQKIPRNLEVFELMVEKIVKVRSRNYIGKWGKIVNLSHYFPVPKGSNDIRMVYDLTKSGLNDALWHPGFGCRR